MKKNSTPILLFGFTLICSTSSGQEASPMVLDGDQVRLEIQTAGSAITHFAFKKNPFNPFTWTLEPKDMPKNNAKGPVFRGHFLCMGRWGAPSEAEQNMGIPHNGEVNTLNWKVTKAPVLEGNNIVAESECLEEKDQMKISRKIVLPKGGQSFLMEETAENLLSNDRMYNFVQHPTIGAPFLNPSTVIDCNASLGFDQRAEINNLEKSAFPFPNGMLVDGYADLRKVNDDRGYVTSHIFDDSTKIGWVTATNPEKKLVLGYVFLTKEYPWLNLWHWKKDMKPFAHGLEFGTTGLGRPYKLLADNCIGFFGRKSYEWLEAGGKATKKYICFIAGTPENFEGVGKIEFKKGQIILIEKKEKNPQKLEVKIPDGLIP
jgi:hypothetical protein